jgi:hypothetical protein
LNEIAPSVPASPTDDTEDSNRKLAALKIRTLTPHGPIESARGFGLPYYGDFTMIKIALLRESELGSPEKTIRDRIASTEETR